MLEQFSGLNKKIDGNHQDFLEFKGKMTEFRDKMIGFRGEMISFKDEMVGFIDEMISFKDRTDKNLKIALEYLFRIDEEIQDLKMETKDLKKLLKKKADLERLEIVEKRLIKLEKLVLAKLAR